MEITVRGKTGAASFTCAPGERILHAGLRAGFDLPYECASGTCGSCKARVEHGTTDYHWHEAPGRKFTKSEKNEVLMCQCHPLSDCDLVVARAIELVKERAAKPFHDRGTICAFERLTADVCEFTVELKQPMRFDAGQFALLTADHFPGARSYSMTNTSRDTRRLEFLVKRLPGGKFSEWLLGNDVIGAQVDVFGPLGRATFSPELERPILGIAGGSGAAGFRAILAHAVQDRYFERFPGYMFLGVRTERDAFWLEQLRDFARSAPALSITIALSHEDVPAGLAERFPELQFTRGFVHEVARDAMQGKYENVMAYIAGPPPMVDAVLRILLLEAKLSAKSIRYDKFS